jgi:secondary thiamine-phosphate synthase enzyme
MAGSPDGTGSRCCAQLTGLLGGGTRVELFRRTIEIDTGAREALYDITAQVRKAVAESGIKNGLVSVYAQGATAAVMIQEGWDDSVQNDVIAFLRKLAPRGGWEHDRQDGNADAHLKAGLVGPGETVPVIDGAAGLSTWQNIFFCEFDGPRRKRRVVVTIIGEK